MNKRFLRFLIPVAVILILWFSLDQNLDVKSAVFYPGGKGTSSFTNLTEQLQSDTALTNFYVSGQLWLSNGLYSVGAAAGQLTLNSGTGLGGFTNYAGGIYISNSAAASQPQTYLNTNGDIILGNDLYSPNLQAARVATIGTSGKLVTSNTPIVLVVSNYVTGGGAVVMTNGTLQVSNTASTPGQVISSTNVLQVDASQLGKALQIDTNGNTFLGSLTASRMVFGNANKQLASATASGAVPIDADSTATTFAQVNALAPGNVVTQGMSLATTISNTVSVAGVSGGFAWAMSPTTVTLTNIIYTNVTLNFGSTAAASFSDLLVNVANLKSNDTVTINAPAISQTNGIFSAWISNTFLYARYHNYAATAIDPASGIFNMQVFQYK